MTSARLLVGVFALALRWAKGRLIVVCVLLTLGTCASSAQTGDIGLIVRSAASYQQTVSPNSLAVVFGTNLATTSLSAQLDGSGQFPTALGGTTVSIGGELARLINVSPTQIDLLIPPNIKPGMVTVVVTPFAVPSVSGTAMIDLAAPGLFSVDGTGQGPGSILNALTFAPGPFFVDTSQYSGTDKRTRVAIFGTGIRYAGNPNMDPAITNVADNVVVQVVDSSGTIWPLPVEYAGAAPIYAGPEQIINAVLPARLAAPVHAGLDQVTAVLPPGLDGAGIVGLTVSAGMTASNTVTVVVASSVPPSISSVSLSPAPPGSQIQVFGGGFAPNLGSQLRTKVFLKLPDGTLVSMPNLDITPVQILTMLPPIPLGTEGAWYSGPADLCVQVDGQTSCAPGKFEIAPRLVSSQAPGQVTLTFLQHFQNVLSPITGSVAFNSFIQQQNERNLSQLTNLINQASSGSPPLLQLTNPDGSVTTVPFNVEFLRTFDSLLLATTAPAGGTALQLQSARRALSSSTSSAQSCGIAQEDDLQLMAAQYNSIRSLQKSLAWAYMASVVTAATVGCTLSTVGCLAGAASAVATTLPVANTVYTTASWSLFASQIAIEGSNAFLTSIQVQTGSDGNTTTLEVGSSDTLTITGNFAPQYPPGVYTEILVKALTKLLTDEFAPICGPQGAPTRDACNWVFSQTAKAMLDLAATSPEPPAVPQGPNNVALSSSSITATPPSTPEVSLSLPCLGAGRIVGNAATPPGGETFGLAANAGSLLIYGNYSSPPTSASSAPLTVIVSQPARLQSLTVAPSSITGGNSVTGTVTLTRGAPKGGFPVQLASSNIHASLPTPSFIIPEGQRQQQFTINTLAVAAAEIATISASSGAQTVSATFSIQPSASTLSLVLSSSSVNGGGTVTGTVSFTPPLAVFAIVALASSNSAAQVLSSVQVSPSGVGSFIIATTTVSSPQTAIITATYGSYRSSVALQITSGPTAALSGIQLDRSTVTGGDTVFGTVILTSPSPTGGTTVTLQSTDSSIALVQAFTVVPAGRASATFSISTYAVMSVRSVVISGSAGGISKSVSLTLNPANIVTLSGFGVAPNPVYGGSAAIGTLLLSDLAPSGGATITIQTSNSSLVQVPFTVTIPQAADSYEFVITTTPVDGTQSVVVTASYKGSSSSVVITLLPVD